MNDHYLRILDFPCQLSWQHPHHYEGIIGLLAEYVIDLISFSILVLDVYVII